MWFSIDLLVYQRVYSIDSLKTAETKWLTIGPWSSTTVTVGVIPFNTNKASGVLWVSCSIRFWIVEKAKRWTSCVCHHMGGSTNGGTPIAGWFIMENTINMDVWGVPLFQETPIYIYIYVYIYNVWLLLCGYGIAMDQYLQIQKKTGDDHPANYQLYWGSPKVHGFYPSPYMNICLVVDLPLWKIWVCQLGLLFPIYGNIKFMFQTTNQICICIIYTRYTSCS